MLGAQAEGNNEENYQEEYEDKVGRPVIDPCNNTGRLYSVAPCTNAPTSLSPHEPAPVPHTNMSEVLFNMCRGTDCPPTTYLTCGMVTPGQLLDD
jgi:hypothetical protein